MASVTRTEFEELKSQVKDILDILKQSSPTNKTKCSGCGNEFQKGAGYILKWRDFHGVHSMEICSEDCVVNLNPDEENWLIIK